MSEKYFAAQQKQAFDPNHFEIIQEDKILKPNEIEFMKRFQPTYFKAAHQTLQAAYDSEKQTLDIVKRIQGRSRYDHDFLLRQGDLTDDEKALLEANAPDVLERFKQRSDELAVKEQQQAKDLNVDENEYGRFEADVYSGNIKEEDIRLQVSKRFQRDAIQQGYDNVADYLQKEGRCLTCSRILLN